MPLICNNCTSDQFISVNEQYNTVTKCAKCGSDDIRIDLLCEDVVALTEHLRLKEEECKQLQQDKAELVEAFKECYEWLDGQLTSEYQFELDKFKAVLEKHKCD